MIDLLKKGIYTGVGLSLLAKDKAEELAKKAAKEAKLSGKEGEEFVKELLSSSEEAVSELETKIKLTIQKVLKQLDIPTREEVDGLKKRIEELESKIEDK